MIALIKKLAQSIREYKKPTILTLILIVGEVFIEVLIPFYTADLVNMIKAGAAMGEVVRLGLTLVAMALVSLACGGLAGYTCSKASAGSRSGSPRTTRWWPASRSPAGRGTCRCATTTRAST